MSVGMWNEAGEMLILWLWILYSFKKYDQMRASLSEPELIVYGKSTLNSREDAHLGNSHHIVDNSWLFDTLA